jgi:NAD-dependent dihydropyrimidine dehydrogenase PreA subunit
MKPENREKCTGCAFCAIMCPDAAIEVEREDR